MLWIERSPGESEIEYMLPVSKIGLLRVSHRRGAQMLLRALCTLLLLMLKR